MYPSSLDNFRVEKDSLSAYLDAFHFEISLFAYWNQGEIRKLRNLLLNDFKIAFSTYGSCRITTAEQTHEVGPGDMVILPPYTLHNVDFTTDGAVESFEFHISISPAHAQQWFIDNLKGQIYFPGVITPELRERIMEVYEQTRENTPGSYLLTKHILVELLLRTLSYPEAPKRALRRRLDSQEKVAVDFLGYVDAHYRENLRTQDICRALNVSASHLSRCLQKMVGMTAAQYITHYKLLRAQDLLKTGEKNIQEVSDHLGFSSVYYFSRLFKQHFGETPSSFMKRYLPKTDPEP